MSIIYIHVDDSDFLYYFNTWHTHFKYFSVYSLVIKLYECLIMISW